MAFDFVAALIVGFGFGISGFFMEFGKAVSDIYFRPWLKKLKRKNDRLLRVLRRSAGLKH
jgi:hypothetical protein